MAKTTYKKKEACREILRYTIKKLDMVIDRGEHIAIVIANSSPQETPYTKADGERAAKITEAARELREELSERLRAI